MTDQEKIERQTHVNRLIDSLRNHGIEPTQSSKPVFDQYVAGELSTAQMITKIKALNA